MAGVDEGFEGREAGRPRDGEERESLRFVTELPTRLEHYMRTHGILPAKLSAASGVSRSVLHRIRQGRTTPRAQTISAITKACRQLSNDPTITALTLFDLD